MFEKKALKAFYTSSCEAALYFDLEGLEKFFSDLSNSLPENVHFLFPIKSFPDKRILELAAKHFKGFDFSNVVEYELVKEFLNRDHVLWCSSIFPFDSAQVDHKGVIFSDNSYIFNDSKVLHSVRVSIDDVARDSNFGVEVSKLSRLKQEYDAIHFHDSLRKERETWINDVAVYLNKFSDFKFVNLGGGFFDYSREELLKKVNELADKFPEKKLYFEPGRWLVYRYGLAFGRILDITDTSKFVRVVSTLSKECHLRWMEERFKVRFHNFTDTEKSTSELEKKSRRYRLIGPTCTEIDHLGEFELGMNPPSRGDIISLSGINGYCVAWNRSFNGVPEAKVIFL